MWSFEGDYRRKPQQRLGGASKSRNIERTDLLNQLKLDREEREVSSVTRVFPDQLQKEMINLLTHQSTAIH